MPMKNRQKLEAFIQKHADYFNNVSRETYEAITGAADIREIQKYIKNQNETEEIDMCDALKQMQEESMKKGMQQGMQQGVRQVAVRLLRMNHPIPFIAQATDLSEKEIEEIKASMES